MLLAKDYKHWFRFLQVTEDLIVDTLWRQRVVLVLVQVSVSLLIPHLQNDLNCVEWDVKP